MKKNCLSTANAVDIGINKKINKLHINILSYFLCCIHQIPF